MRQNEFRQSPGAQKKFYIFGGVVLAIIAWLVLPSWLAGGKTAGAGGRAGGERRTPGKPTPAPVAAPAAGVAPVAAPITAPAPVAAVDPYAGMLGKWGGQVWLNEVRGECALTMTIKHNENPGGAVPAAALAGFTTLSCGGQNIFALIAGKAPRKEVEQAEADARLRAMTSTSATFTGEPKDGAIEFNAVDNIGVAASPDGCAMLSMRAKGFDSGVSVRWAETGKPGCNGGEMILTRK